jgi:hypothetical protein
MNSKDAVKKYLILLCMFSGSLAFAQAEDPKIVPIKARAAAYVQADPEKLMGYFPAGALLTILDESAATKVLVRYTSKSGKVIEAMVRRKDVGLPPKQLTRRQMKDSVWEVIESDDYDKGSLTARTDKVLALKDFKWRHAHTEHFVIHFEREIFARKVASMAEFLYDYIADDLGSVKDIRSARSHIFIFRKPERWQIFVKEAGDPNLAWAFAIVEGMSMFLQQADDTQSSSSVLAHEMTHLVMNRFYRGNPPLWLNEGMAEWYSEFGRAAFKGIKKSQRAQFKKLKKPLNVQQMLVMDQYPADKTAVRAFYDTAKFFVAYLRLEYPKEKFPPFVLDMVSGKDMREALEIHYGITDEKKMLSHFKKFSGIR